MVCAHVRSGATTVPVRPNHMPHNITDRPAGPVGIKDIARALGVSVATVSRALQAPGKVSPLTRSRVLDEARALGYQPNLAARYLKRRQPVRISVQIPEEIALFWRAVRDGIREAAAPFAPVLEIDFRTYRAPGQGDIPVFEQVLRDGTDGLVITPTNPVVWKPYLDEAVRRRLPVVCVVTDAPDSERLTSVSADPFSCGAMAGELLTRLLPVGGDVAFVTGWLATHEHALKLRGFQAGVKSAGSPLKATTIIEAHDDEGEAYQKTVDLLQSNRDVKAIYVSTANSLPVLRAAEDEHRLPALTIVTTDLFPELVPWIREGKIVGTVYQRPITQGRLALQALAQYLISGVRPLSELRVAPHLVMRSNLDFFLERLGAERDPHFARTIRDVRRTATSSPRHGGTIAEHAP
jgi:LacI family transcriptional regulator